MLTTCMYMQYLDLLLQHPDKTPAIFVWNRWNIWNIHLKHTCIAITTYAISWSTVATSIGCPPSPPEPRSTCTFAVLTRWTRSLPCILTLVDIQMSATVASHQASWSLGPSFTFVLHRSRSIGTVRPYLTITSPSTTVSELHTCTPQAKRHVAQPNSHHC
jgi:hypothetical protein